MSILTLDGKEAEHLVKNINKKSPTPRRNKILSTNQIIHPNKNKSGVINGVVE
jgi:hypothetical protein